MQLSPARGCTVFRSRCPIVAAGPANNPIRLSSRRRQTIYSHHCPSRSRAHTTLPPTSALLRTATAPRAILRGGLTPAVTPGPVWFSSSYFVTVAVVSPSSDEEVLGIRLLLLFVKLRRDLVWHTSNRAAWRMVRVAQGSTMDRRGQSTHCKVSAQHWALTRRASRRARLSLGDNGLICSLA